MLRHYPHNLHWHCHYQFFSTGIEGFDCIQFNHVCSKNPFVCSWPVSELYSISCGKCLNPHIKNFFLSPALSVEFCLFWYVPKMSSFADKFFPSWPIYCEGTRVMLALPILILGVFLWHLFVSKVHWFFTYSRANDVHYV